MQPVALIGSFGETLVIDWGLAKYLHEQHEPQVEPGPFRTSDRTLTAVLSPIPRPTGSSSPPQTP